MELKNKERQMRNIRLIKKLSPHLFVGYNNLIFINLKVKEIKLAKQLFVHNVELGDEAYIPAELN